MSADDCLRVVLLWHMHQPQYRVAPDGQYRLPWTYLHGIKDYTDMAAHLEAVPEARAVVNFAPVLLDQLVDYATHVRAALDDGAPIRDPQLSALAMLPPREREHERRELLIACLRSNERRLMRPFPVYDRLAVIARHALDEPAELAYLDDQYFVDLVVWYHLAWLGETIRRGDDRVRALIDKNRRFHREDRLAILGIIAELLDGLIGRYRRLADEGRVELSVSPFAHPMLPLLIDFATAREALPELPLPAGEGYPGGEERARWHLEEGIAVFERHFGRLPRGCWPSEGGLSDATLRLLGRVGFEWTASGEGVLLNSARRRRAGESLLSEELRFRPCRAGDPGPACFFRDDTLSDRIGFEYAGWHADDAVANLLAELERIRGTLAHPGRHVVGIMLDGENAWEHYPHNGFYFLSALYTRLSDHPGLRLTTFSECLDSGLPVAALPGVVAGSWVHGTLATWIGHPDKNRAWERLVEAKRAFDRVMGGERLSPEQREAALQQLAVCEGSDWFWWLGDDNPPEATAAMEGLFRRHLRDLYGMLEESPPAALHRPLGRGGGQPEGGGVMRRGTPQAAEGGEC